MLVRENGIEIKMFKNESGSEEEEIVVDLDTRIEIMQDKFINKLHSPYILILLIVLFFTIKVST
jgi:hypothetical protein